VRKDNVKVLRSKHLIGEIVLLCQSDWVPVQHAWSKVFRPGAEVAPHLSIGCIDKTPALEHGGDHDHGSGSSRSHDCSHDEQVLLAPVMLALYRYPHS
jgi:hypothetical protein